MAARGCQCERLSGPFRGPDRRTATPVGGVASGSVPHDPEFHYSDLLPTGADDTPYRLVTAEGVSTFEADGLSLIHI